MTIRRKVDVAAKTPTPRLTEDDVRRIATEVFNNLMQHPMLRVTAQGEVRGPTPPSSLTDEQRAQLTRISEMVRGGWTQGNIGEFIPDGNTEYGFSGPAYPVTIGLPQESSSFMPYEGEADAVLRHPPLDVANVDSTEPAVDVIRTSVVRMEPTDEMLGRMAMLIERTMDRVHDHGNRRLDRSQMTYLWRELVRLARLRRQDNRT